ncbi:TraQ conjugal transfer family protein [Elizabethkingia anophelis]|uniref:Conjugative transposon protein TraQ n=2 Tax=Elizabethkingia anophelis TaxID=1117645 RepID=A0A455ZF82_9FLAO|nr:TraQ conjugal transfer family protein [Elizabethkingia anophelis]AIL46974.1 Conjugative transposon protein TraQ [Elizabethkingia anophelis NUHP1]DAC75426.1 TPA_exp: conjugative transposon protein TraQ [Elizabethkingia anophelis]
MKKSITKITSGLSIYVFIAILGASFSFVSCDSSETVEIQRNLPFEVAAMPVPTTVVAGQVVEIRLSILRNDNYAGAKFSLRYFQYAGRGTLKYDGELPFQPNNLYPIPSKEFRLYYTASADSPQTFDIWIADNFGNERKISFQFTYSGARPTRKKS